MHPLIIVSIILAALIVLILLAALVCFIMVFYSGKRKALGPDEYEIPPGKIYEVFREDMVNWTKQIRTMPHEDIEIQSYDGLTLRGTYYEYAPDATVELLFHGYRGNAERDLCGGIERCFALGRSAIIIDQRAGGKSDGHIITFGIRERYDCLSWIRYATERFGKDRKIVIGGVSMGAATVMLAAGENLPENVVCVMADCGYTSAKDIIKKVIRDMGLPPKIIYPFAKLGARLYGGFNLEESSSVEALKRATVPVIFFHGEDDAFVPCRMSEECYDACASRKRLVKVAGAGHGLAYPLSGEQYIEEIKDFFG